MGASYNNFSSSIFLFIFLVSTIFTAHSCSFGVIVCKRFSLFIHCTSSFRFFFMCFFSLSSFCFCFCFLCSVWFFFFVLHIRNGWVLKCCAGVHLYRISFFFGSYQFAISSLLLLKIVDCFNRLAQVLKLIFEVQSSNSSTASVLYSALLMLWKQNEQNI